MLQARCGYLMQTVEAGRGEVLVEAMHLKARQRAEVVEHPLPGVAEDVRETFRDTTNDHHITSHHTSMRIALWLSPLLLTV